VAAAEVRGGKTGALNGLVDITDSPSAKVEITTDSTAHTTTNSDINIIVECALCLYAVFENHLLVLRLHCKNHCDPLVIFWNLESETIILTPEQSVMIFGWLGQPRLTLVWEDIKLRSWTWRNLREFGLSAEQLHAIQPDKFEWIQRGGLQMKDLPDMTVFPINPLTDFRADLGEVWNMKYTPAQMHSMGITFDHLLQAGLTPPVMYYFNFPLSAWHTLNFGESHARLMNDSDVEQVFRIQKHELLDILCTFEKPDL
jgi:hypothetical protein